MFGGQESALLVRQTKGWPKLGASEQKSTKIKARTALDWALLDVQLPLRDLKRDDVNPRINALNRFVGNPIGSPYCAAGVSWCFHQAGASGFPFHGLAKDIRDWFEARGRLSHDPQNLLDWHGALFGWTLANGHGHIGFVEKRLTDAGDQVISIGTVEYNTTPPDGAGADGAYQKTHPVFNGGEMWFLRCDDFQGGAWWE